MNSEQILEFFREITAIPRESGHEEPMTEYLLDFARKHGLESKSDAIGNVLITKPAAPGYENVPTLVLQSHQDMVCEKVEGSMHDFSKDPIHYEIEDGWMIAKETTLGADDGIGIASELSALVSDKPSGKLECLFTISEETGMNGAGDMQEGFFTGRTLINLDSEDEGQIFIGCAGGIDTDIVYKAGTTAVPEGCTALSLSIYGGLGGHSGDDINKSRANAVQQMARFLYSELDTEGFGLVSIDGGGKRNAIARDCKAVIVCRDASSLGQRFTAFGKTLADEYRVTDPGLGTASSETGIPQRCLIADECSRLVGALYSCPHGVLEMSQDIKDFVETSTNLASVRTTGDGVFHITTSQRSSTMSEREMASSKVEAHFRLIGARVRHLSPYPGWKPDLNSRILKQSVSSYNRLFNVEPQVLAIHAGLECGLFLEKFPGLDMISIGPTLRGVHAPGEKLDLASLDKYVALLDDIITNYN